MSYPARAAGSHEDGTSRFTFSDNAISGKIVGRVANALCKSPSQRSAPKIHLCFISVSESVIDRLPSTSLLTHQVLVNEGW
ncbi:hypothetical protein L1987_37325 [Smallanthus sonchifolius]|uniref:Uncharacterized protein n=1 Tax=Smallanthus sonchifolius TaxID=185202 RepID=A0ACB9HG12_9ASTR|nr:hypothetical protein L1987_37325 [Smallanthus sonchifolius]